MLAKPEYFSLPDEVCCWRGRRGGTAGTGSRRKQLAGAPWRSCWYGQPAEAAGGSAAEGWSEAAVCAEKLAAGRATMRRHRGRACRWARTMQLHQEGAKQHREGAEQHREGAEHHREEAKWQQSALYSIFIPVPQAPYCHTYHNKIQQRCVILLYRE